MGPKPVHVSHHASEVPHNLGDFLRGVGIGREMEVVPSCERREGERAIRTRSAETLHDVGGIRAVIAPVRLRADAPNIRLDRGN